MKILLVSMNSIHFRRWSEQLKDSGHEVFWFDILDQGYAPSMSWMTQITGWKKGFLKRRGRTFLKSKLPKLFNALVHRYDSTIDDAFSRTIQEIQPDVVHSFALYVSCAPILNVMKAHSNISWIYSSWGSDLFYYKNDPDHLKDIKAVLARIDYMFADCKRDQYIADELGFKGVHLGVFPGGGGFDIAQFEKFKIPFEKRKIIAVKGNQDRSGRAIPVLKALELLKDELKNYEVIVFGAQHPEVIAFKESSIPHITISGLVSHEEIIQLLCKSFIYIGNSNSDGMPNTLLEAICAGAFPIQSNPGGATAEIIENEKNGLLIEDCEDVEHIKAIISSCLNSKGIDSVAVSYNDKYLKNNLDLNLVKRKVLMAYDSVKEI